MEALLRRSSQGGHAVVLENNSAAESNIGDHGKVYKDEIVAEVEKHEAGHITKPSFPELKDFLSKKKNDKLGSARAEMNEVREENQRLREYLDKMTNDYQTLKLKFQDIVQQEAKKSVQHKEIEEDKFVSLSLGRSMNDSRKAVPKIKEVKDKNLENEDLALGLDCKFDAPKASSSTKMSEEVKEEARETSPWSKVSNKTTRSVDDEVSQPVKKARVSVRAKCDAPTMNDGCQWRKYGQKISKGNPCPRAYYRCTVATSCPVRKQVQRCADDMSILITTYEGTHNHPLPVSATAMASTTSAAACMLLSGSTASQNSLSSSTNVSNLHGLNNYMSNSDNLISKQFYLPSSSIPSSSPFQTITLDLTSTPASRYQDSYQSSSRYPSTNLNFNSFEPNTIPWGSFASQNYKGSQIRNLGKQTVENIYQSYMQNTKANTIHAPSRSGPDMVTKAIATDPYFQTVLAAALTSIMGTSTNGGNLENFDQKLKLVEAFSRASNGSHVEVHKGKNCLSSLGKTPFNLHAGNTTLLPPSLSLSISKSASASPDDNENHTD